MALARWLLAAPPKLAVEERWTQVDGHVVHYLQAGSGPELILLHGLLGTASSWVPSLEDLAANSTIYAVDALGIGRSERVTGLDAGLRASAQRVAGFMDVVGLKDADFLATSHGGAVALMFAALYPEKVRSLALHAPANPFSKIADPLIRFYGTRLGTWFAYQVPTLPRAMQSLALGRMYGSAAQVRPAALENYIRSLAVPGTVAHVLRILEHWAQDMQQLEDLLPRVPAVPVLLLWGTHDRAVSRESGEELAERLADAEIAILPENGHLPYEEDPERFTLAVNRFLARLDRNAHPTLAPLKPALKRKAPRKSP